MNCMDIHVLTVPEQLDFDIFQTYKEQLSGLSDSVTIIVDFQHIKQVDYIFLHTLLAMKSCFSSCLNEIQFVNYSAEVCELFEDVQLEQFLRSPNLIH